MAYAKPDGVRLYFEETGSGTPIIFVHEFGGDCRSWEAQVRYLSRFYQCITFNARGYPPSDVPTDETAYSQEIFTRDIAAVLESLSIERAHVVGLSMGSFSTLMFGIEFPEKCRSITLCGCGYGSIPEQRQAWLDSNSAMAERIEEDPIGTAEAYAAGPARMIYKKKDPRGWEEFLNGLKNLSPRGAALTLKGVQCGRPAVTDLEIQLRALDLPALIVVGDEDDPALEPSLYLKRQIRNAGLCIFPKTGHAVNTEEPALFNQALLEFLTAVDNGR
ncbi:MAG: alpha/beta hydrolase [Rhodospirillales bacterium]|nr:alpha/beta hydrolase [Rhodospirillales bacterium]